MGRERGERERGGGEEREKIVCGREREVVKGDNTQRMERYMSTKYIHFHPVYSAAPQEVVDPLIYEGFVEELVEVLEIRDNSDELVVRWLLSL